MHVWSGREVWRVDLWRYQDSLLPFTSLGRCSSVPQAYTISKKACWYPKVCVYGAWNGSSGCGCLCEVVGDWNVNKVVNDPIHNGDSGLRSKNTGTGTAAHFLSCHRCVWFPCHTSSSQLVLSASHAGGKHRFWFSWLLGEHVETTMCAYGEIRQCTWQCQLLLECDH